MKNFFFGLMIVLVGLTSKSPFAHADDCKLVELHVHGAYTARIDYQGCNGWNSIDVLAGQTHTGSARVGEKVRVEINQTGLSPDWTKNGALVQVPAEGMKIDCGKTTTTAHCDCNGQPCTTG